MEFVERLLLAGGTTMGRTVTKCTLHTRARDSIMSTVINEFTAKGVVVVRDHEFVISPTLLPNESGAGFPSYFCLSTTQHKSIRWI